MATKKGVWNLQQVRDKQLQSLWNYQNGTLWAWGSGGGGTLGLNNEISYSSPVQVGTDTTWVITENGRPKANAQSGFVSIKGDGTLWGVGDNGWGQLGQNNRADYSSPTQIPGTDWKFLANPTNTMGGDTTYAIKNNGQLWAWGSNTYGKLGQDGPVYTHRSSPVQVGSDTTWNNIASAASVVGAVKTDGTLWTWGRNPYGELGQNDRTARSSPVQIPGTTWRTIYTGHYGLAAIKTDGTLWSWGYNTYGQLGVNDRTRRSSPTQIPGTTWDQYSAGNACSFGFKTDGTLWAWGYNDKGALGVLDSHDAGNNYSSPVQIPGTTWSSISAMNNSHGGFALKSDNTLWAWGYNYTGQLAQSDLTDRSSPVQIPGTWSGVIGSGAGAIAFKNA